jgi:hypothetical protein
VLQVLSLPKETKDAFLSEAQDDVIRVVSNLNRMGTEEYEYSTGQASRYQAGPALFLCYRDPRGVVHVCCGLPVSML